MAQTGVSSLDMFRLGGKVALVTGSASGLGAAIAKSLAQAGAAVATHGNRRAADETTDEILAMGRESAAFSADLSSTTGPQDLFEQAVAKFGRVDILVNNAGTIHRDAAVDTTLESWMQVVQVNLTSVFQLSQLIARDVFARGGKGKIVNIASLLSFQGGIRVPAYAASKGGVAQLTKAFANEWAGRGINVNAIAPGYMATDNTAPLRADPVRSEAILSRIPAGRWGTPADVAAPVVFLASKASDYVNGHVLVIDGGWLAR